jgi:DNA-binding NtrC family response regulator
MTMSEETAKSREVTPGKGHILIVDDDAFFTKVLRIILTGEGFEVSSATDMAEAHALLGKARFDVIISDLRMPDGNDGLTLLAQLRSEGNRVPFIVLTGYGEVDNYMTAMNAGAAEYLNKPVRSEELFAVIENCLHSRKPAP